MKNIKHIILFVLLYTLNSSIVLAGGGSWTHYSRMTTTAIGKGLVYTGLNPTDNPAFVENSSEARNETDSNNEYDQHVFHIYAKAQEGSFFKGWYSDANCTKLLAETEYYKFPISCGSGDKNAPSEGMAYAKFEPFTLYYYSRINASVVGQGTVAVSEARTNNPLFSATSSAQMTSGKTSAVYYLYARGATKNNFSGWYSDEACTKLISNQAYYTYTVEALSTDDNSPSTYAIYAKFVPSAEQYYQLGNAGFEEWENVDGGKEPKQWNSFLTASGGQAGMVKSEQLKQSTDAHGGKYSAQINARNVIFSIIAQGNLTTGCINAGSMSATDASGNYNYTNESNQGQAMRFTGRPDSMKVWIKSQCSGNVKIAALLHEKGYYQDPNTANVGSLSRLVGQATASPASNGGKWTEYTIPFTYATDKYSDRPYYALVSFATNSTPGQGSASDVMYVDDITMVYNSELKSISMGNRAITISEGKGTFSGSYNVNKLDVTLTGVAASYVADYNEETSTLLVTVYGDNYDKDPTNFHTYSIYFEGGEEPTIDAEDMYPISFDPDAERIKTHRTLNHITLQEDGGEELILDINPERPYNDLTDVVFSVSNEGRPLNVAFDFEGSWMHSYAYIDLDNDGLFDFIENATNHSVKGDLMAYSFYSFSTTNVKEGYNSLGHYIKDDERNVLDLPTFNLPTTPGFYRMRIKIDWNSIDPAGDTVQGILENAGYIVDFTLEVSDPNLTSIPAATVKPATTTAYDLHGRAIKTNNVRGICIVNGKKIIR